MPLFLLIADMKTASLPPGNRGNPKFLTEWHFCDGIVYQKQLVTFVLLWFRVTKIMFLSANSPKPPIDYKR